MLCYNRRSFVISLSLGKCVDLCKPDSGVWDGASDHGGKAHVAAYSQLVHGLDLEQPAVVHAVCCIDGFKVPALQQTYCLLYYSYYSKSRRLNSVYMDMSEYQHLNILQFDSETRCTGIWQMLLFMCVQPVDLWFLVTNMLT